MDREHIIIKWKPYIQGNLYDFNVDDTILFHIGLMCEKYMLSDLPPFDILKEYKNLYVKGDLKHNIDMCYVVFKPNSPISRNIKIEKILKNGYIR
jgi:hypothetical protein